MDEYMKHCIQIFFNDVCSVTSCEDKTIKPHRDARLFMFQVMNRIYLISAGMKKT